MTNQQIIEKAIQKAIDGGWDVQFTAKDCYRKWYKKSYTDPDDVMGVEIGNTEYQFDREHPNNLIFNHEFAKALWDQPIPNTNAYNSYELNGRDIYEWQYHLANMVIADDPIKYLGDNIE